MKFAKTVGTLPLLFALLLGVSACGEAAETQPMSDTAQTEPSAETETAAPEETYRYPELDLGGAEFPILNADCASWGFYSRLDSPEQDGEALNDAFYLRNRTVEEQFNTKIAVTEVWIDDCARSLLKVVTAGDDVYSAASVARYTLPVLLNANALLDLKTVDGLRLDEVWWDQDSQKLFDIGNLGIVRFAACDISLTGLECTVCTFFNERIASLLDLESPYQIVRDGKWTFDRMMEFSKTAANLNGDDNFKFKQGGNARYGIVSYSTFPDAMMYAAGEASALLDADGIPYLAYGGDRFFGVTEKIASFTSQPGIFNEFNDTTKGEYYEDIFRDGRSLLTIAQVKTAQRLRSMDDNFGILPMPKYDEEQDAYHCFTTGTQEVLCMPVTVGDAGSAGIVADALAYLSYSEVMPTYYDISLTQKGIRNEDSVEMMALIRDNRVMDIGATFGWTETLRSKIESTLMRGKTDLASEIAKQTEKIQQNIDKTLEDLLNIDNG